ncbi:MAG TPA: GNAT family N-acetyltransferase [Azospirillaceae bacterium]|nr:GNAT family N-acetyltransferase [Azospirillaceae bacterium]
MPIIRQAVPGDAPAVVALINGLAAETDQMVLSPIDPARTETVAKHLARLAEGPEFMLLAMAEETIVGFLLASAESHPDRRGVVEIDIGVAEKFRGGGFGRRLLNAAEGHAVARGVHRLQLRVLSENSRAIALYQAAGFEVEGLMRKVVRRGDALKDQYLMAKLLN